MEKDKVIGSITTTREVTRDVTYGELVELLRQSHGAHLQLADEVLNCVSWHDNMPKSTKLNYIEMLEYHIGKFK